MKTILDLDEELLGKARTAAALRRISLETFIENVLRCGLVPQPISGNSENFPDSGPGSAKLEEAPGDFEMGPIGFLVLRRKPGETITLGQIRKLRDELEQDELERTLTACQA